jgi:hypothetical protein
MATPENIMREFQKISAPQAKAKMVSELSGAAKMWQKNGVPAARLIAEDIARIGS